MVLYDLLVKIIEYLKGLGCGIKTHYHIYCPGCGGTRALEALLHFNIIESLKYNPVVFFLFIDVIVIIVLGIVERRKGCKKHYAPRIILNVMVLIVLFGFFVFRNYMLLYKGIDLLGDFS